MLMSIGLGLLLLLILSGCARDDASGEGCAKAGGSGTCEVDGFGDRPYVVFLPSSFDPAEQIPVVLGLHGGGGRAAPHLTCPGGDESDPLCLHGVGESEGFITVYPNGTGFRPLRGIRTWNAGGGADGWNCSSGKACEQAVDDLGYIDAVLADLSRSATLDTNRIYATGLSNGAAMSHRLACERSDVFAAVVAVAGSNQFATAAQCEPSRPISVMQIHGTADPCWEYETSDRACLGSNGRKMGALESSEGWAEINGCTDHVEGLITDAEPDATSVQVATWSACEGRVEVSLLTVHGGGHTWPNGDPGLDRLVGEVSTEIDSSTIWEFMSRWTLE
jgi:polyhydroxybutyrate depolymerase